ncbi:MULTISPECIES: GtrA family protein [unclassified Lentilitoribacter]|jgi:putative flippase GtrA|uniref:GtrA family protein n=1 Tax=unclassified Lentilitoribacter TaxID=2647570 RepID=UPI0013A6F2FE|nr:GtrA family protein [Lentilitoribacter sp. Alg239-R112]
MRKLFFFGIAGSIGFIVDAGVLILLLHFTPLDPFSARIFAIAAAMFCTWMINRNFTFQKGGRSVAKEGMRYGSVGITSALINYTVYSGLLIQFSELRPVFAVVIASAVATIWSYVGYSKFVFAAPKNSPEK